MSSKVTEGKRHRRDWRNALGQQLEDHAAIQAFLFEQLHNATQEVLAVLLLDKAYRVLHFYQIRKADLATITTYPSEVIKRALVHKAYAIVLARSCSSQNPRFDQMDVKLPQALKNLLALVDVHVVDHVLVTQDTCVSLAEAGRLK